MLFYSQMNKVGCIILPEKIFENKNNKNASKCGKNAYFILQEHPDQE